MAKYTNTIIRRLLPTNCLSVFCHFVELVFKGLNIVIFDITQPSNNAHTLPKININWNSAVLHHFVFFAFTKTFFMKLTYVIHVLQEILAWINLRSQRVQTYFTPCSGVSIVNFEQLNADWDETFNHREME